MPQLQDLAPRRRNFPVVGVNHLAECIDDAFEGLRLLTVYAVSVDYPGDRFAHALRPIGCAVPSSEGHRQKQIINESSKSTRIGLLFDCFAVE